MFDVTPYTSLHVCYSHVPTLLKGLMCYKSQKELCVRGCVFSNVSQDELQAGLHMATSAESGLVCGLPVL